MLMISPAIALKEQRPISPVAGELLFRLPQGM
jgi:hypothetical protein